MTSSFRVINKTINFSTKGEIDFIDLTEKIQELVSESKISNGFVHIFAPHATGIVVLTENDPALLYDIRSLLSEIAPANSDYKHPSNAHAHLRSLVFSASKLVPIIRESLGLGTWQSILFIETDVYPRQRTVVVQLIGQ